MEKLFEWREINDLVGFANSTKGVYAAMECVDDNPRRAKQNFIVSGVRVEEDCITILVKRKPRQ